MVPIPGRVTHTSRGLDPCWPRGKIWASDLKITLFPKACDLAASFNLGGKRRKESLQGSPASPVQGVSLGEPSLTPPCAPLLCGPGGAGCFTPGLFYGCVPWLVLLIASPICHRGCFRCQPALTPAKGGSSHTSRSFWAEHFAHAGPFHTSVSRSPREVRRGDLRPAELEVEQGLQLSPFPRLGPPLAGPEQSGYCPIHPLLAARLL